MGALALRGLAARRLRTILTASAVVLGVALISGTYILTDTINRSFDQIFTTGLQGIDVAVTPTETVKQSQGGGSAAATIPASALDRVRRVGGVKQAAGDVFDVARIFDKRGHDVAAGGAPDFVASAQPPPFSPFDYVAGRPPEAPDEVALDKGTADKASYRVGESVRVAGDGPVRRYRLVGIARYGNVSSLAGASVAVMTLAQAQRVLRKGDTFDGIDVQAASGTTPEALTRSLRARLPPSLTVRTGRQQAESRAKDTQEGFSFITTSLFVFAGVALFVGGFMIFNTFSITVAQRIREFALLRMLGASRRQVLSEVVLEALAIGFLASLVGLALGLVVAPGLRGLFKAFGAEIPSSGTVFEPRTVVVSLLVGTLVTLVAALVPALRATRVAPVEALVDASGGGAVRSGRGRTIVATLLTLAGVALMAVGLFGGAEGDSALAPIGAGAALVLLGVGLLSAYLVRPIASAVGWPVERVRGLPGRLARENAVRNPRRTASTAAALMIGVALIAFVAVFAAGITATVDRAVDDNFKGAFIVQDENGFSPIPAASAAAIARVPGVARVSPANFSQAKVRGVSGNVNFSGVDPATFPALYSFTWKEGSNATLARLAPGQVLLSRTFARDNGFAVGDTLDTLTATGRRPALRVAGIYEDRGNLLGDATMTNTALRRGFGARQDAFALVGLAPGAGEPAVKETIGKLLDAGFPTVEALTKAEFKDSQAAKVNQVLALFYVMLSLSVIVALFGIANTLALSIHERTRELGMLRAIGTSRAQVRTIIRWEAVITALIGALIGVALGCAFGALITQPLKEQGFVLRYPVATLVALVIVAGLFGVVAALLPARRAARIDVLEALAYE